MEEERTKWKDLPKKEKRKIIGLYGAIVIVSLLGIAYHKFMRQQPQNFTIGTIDQIWKPAKGGKQVSFKYYVNGTEYDGNVDYYGFERTAKPGKRFLVNFPEDYVWEGFMNLNISIPDSLTAPSNGWDEQPNF